MKRDVSLFIVFNEEHSENKIISILTEAQQKLAFKYYAYEWSNKYFSANELQPADALKRIKEKDEESSILCKYQDTSFYFNFYNENEYLSIFLWPASYPWKKEFLNGDQTVEFDLQRYLRLMLDMTKGLKINKIEAKIEWE
jgi:hypothetical protein